MSHFCVIALLPEDTENVKLAIDEISKSRVHSIVQNGAKLKILHIDGLKRTTLT